MKKIMFLTVLVVLLAVPMASYAETAQECASDCVNQCQSLGSGKEYAACMENCLKGCYDKPAGIPDVPPPQPANPSQSRSEDNTYIVIASNDSNSTCAHAAQSSGDSCCQNSAGETKGYCPEGYPIFKDVKKDECPNGTCYKYLNDCMKAGWGFCYTCSSCE